MENNEACNNKLEGKIITGCASGIGEATVVAFFQNGSRAVVIPNIQDVKGQNLAESIGTHRCTYINCEVTDEDQVKPLMDSTVHLYGPLDTTFCNASITTVLDLDLDSYEKLFVVNVHGMAACVKHSACSMVEGGVKGSIICTSSVAASTVTDTFTDYSCRRIKRVLDLMKCVS